MPAADALAPYLHHIRGLPFVRGARLDQSRKAQQKEQSDARLHIRTARATYEFKVGIIRPPATALLLEAFLARVRHAAPRWVLLTPYVSGPAGKRLAAEGINYVDTAGNCRLALGAEHVAIIEGQKPERVPDRARGLGTPGYQVLFALLARPELARTTVREIATEAGAGKTAAARVVARLRDEGLITGHDKRAQVTGQEIIMQRWLVGYSTLVRRRLFLGTFRTREVDPAALEQRIEIELPDTTAWAWGGGAAAMRLTGYYRGETTILHIDRIPADFLRRVHAQRSPEGNLTLLRAPGPVAYRGVKPRTVHPLLVYTELLDRLEERARDAAEELRVRYLQAAQ